MAVIIGLDQFHYAIVEGDEVGGTTYASSVHVPNITQANTNFNSSVETFFADDGPAVVYSQIGEVEVEINIADLPPEDYAKLIGGEYENGMVQYNVSASAPDVALAFRAQKSNGKYRYMWLLKGKFSVPNMEARTKEASVNFQPQTINFKGAARASDRNVFKRIDSDDANLPAGVDDTSLLNDFFEDPNYVPTEITE